MLSLYGVWLCADVWCYVVMMCASSGQVHNLVLAQLAHCPVQRQTSSCIQIFEPSVNLLKHIYSLQSKVSLTLKTHSLLVYQNEMSSIVVT